MLRNVASQKWRVYAWDTTTGQAKTGDAANITAYLTIDDGTPAAITDTNPTEVSSTNEKGYYDFDVTQAESNGAKLTLSPKSSTSNIAVIACPPVVYTRPQYFSLLGIASDGDLTKVNTLDGHTAQTGDSFARIGANGAGLTSVGLADGAITAAKLASDAITAAKVAEDVGTEIGTAVWATTTRVLTAGTNIALAKGTGVTGFNDLDAAGVRSAVGLASANLDTQLAALPTAAENADAVWTELIADHSGVSGSTAEALNAAGSAGDPWTTQLPGAYGAGSAGKIIGDNINATISSRASQTSVDDVPTNAELTTALGTLNDLSAAEVRSAVGLASANLDTQLADLPTSSELTTALGTLNDLDAAGIRAAVGLASANLDTQLGNIVTDTNELQTDWANGGRLDLLIDAILDDTGSSGVVVASGSKTGYSLAAAGLDSVLIESSISAGAGLTNDTGTQLTAINARQALAILAAAIDGVLAGAGTGTITMKPAGKPSGNTRITATTSSGNRTAVSLKVPD